MSDDRTVQPLEVLLVSDRGVVVDEVNECASAVNSERYFETPLRLERAATILDAKQRIERKAPDAVLLDMCMDRANPSASLTHFGVQARIFPFIVLGDDVLYPAALDSVRHGARDYLITGRLSPDLLYRTIRYAIDRCRMTAILQSMSLMDEMTGLYNLKGFFRMVETAIDQVRRKRGSLSMVYAGIEMDDAARAAAGPNDSAWPVLSAVEVLMKSFRGYDILGRVSDDEFAVAAMDLNRLNDHDLINRLEYNIDTLNRTGSAWSPLAMNYGILHFSPIDDNRSVAEIIDCARKGMCDYRTQKGLKPAAGL